MREKGRGASSLCRASAIFALRCSEVDWYCVCLPVAIEHGAMWVLLALLMGATLSLCHPAPTQPDTPYVEIVPDRYTFEDQPAVAGWGGEWRHQLLQTEFCSTGIPAQPPILPPTFAELRTLINRLKRTTPREMRVYNRALTPSLPHSHSISH